MAYHLGETLLREQDENWKGQGHSDEEGVKEEKVCRKGEKGEKQVVNMEEEKGGK